MLAERRKKVVYSNPRGLLWANDDKRFGKQLLQSMGWKEGKGLGKEENGITENIKANYKFDSKGFGYKRKLNDWIEENNVYEQILSDLAQQHSNKGQMKHSKEPSLLNKETEPKLARRISCRKFIKAKNLSLQSEKDLYSIFPTTKGSGLQQLEISNTNLNVNTDSKANKLNQDESAAKIMQLKTIESKLSIQDYFKEKMQKRLNSSQADNPPKQPNTSVIPEEDSDTHFKSKKSKRKLKQTME